MQICKYINFPKRYWRKRRVVFYWNTAYIHGVMWRRV